MGSAGCRFGLRSLEGLLLGGLLTLAATYVSEDKRKRFRVYDAPSPEAVRRAAERSSLPIDAITKVAVLDPYFYR